MDKVLANRRATEDTAQTISRFGCADKRVAALCLAEGARHMAFGARCITYRRARLTREITQSDILFKSQPIPAMVVFLNENK